MIRKPRRSKQGPPNFRAAFLALLAGMFLLVGCGRTDEHPRAWIRGTIKAFILGDNPTSCRLLITPRFAEQTTALRGSSAVRACEGQARRSRRDARTVRVGKVDLNGQVADAAVAIRGGDLDGQTVELRLIEKAGFWKLDRFTRLVRLNRYALLRTFAREYRQRQESTTTGVGGCVLRVLRRAPKQRIAAFLFSGPADAIRRVYEDCDAEEARRVIE